SMLPPDRSAKVTSIVAPSLYVFPLFEAASYRKTSSIATPNTRRAVLSAGDTRCEQSHALDLRKDAVADVERQRLQRAARNTRNNRCAGAVFTQPRHNIHLVLL